MDIAYGGEAMSKTGLIIEGGGMRGIYAAGVLDVLMEHQANFDGVIGVSAGAIHGCCFVSGQNGRSIRYYKKYCADDRFMSFKNLIKTGSFVGTQFCYHDLPDRLDPFDHEAFLKSHTSFYVVCSNLETGKAEYLHVTDMKSQIDLLRASSSLPCLSEIVNYKGMKLLDGGCTDSIPVRVFQEMGYNKNVVILTRHDGYVKKPENTRLVKILYHKYPNFCRALAQRHLIYNQTVEEIRSQEKEGTVFVIRPSQELTIGRLEKNPDKIQEIYNIGREDAKKSLPVLDKWMNGHLVI